MMDIIFNTCCSLSTSEGTHCVIHCDITCVHPIVCISSQDDDQRMILVWSKFDQYSCTTLKCLWVYSWIDLNNWFEHFPIEIWVIYYTIRNKLESIGCDLPFIVVHHWLLRFFMSWWDHTIKVSQKKDWTIGGCELKKETYFLLTSQLLWLFHCVFGYC